MSAFRQRTTRIAATHAADAKRSQKAEPMGLSPYLHHPSPCDREPIPVPATIQPHGALLAVDRLGVITRLAGDTYRAVGVAPDALLGQRIDALVDSEGRRATGAMDRPGPVPRGYVTRWRPAPPGEGAWDVTAHPNQDGTIIEFEPAAATRMDAAQSMAQLAASIAPLDQPLELDELLDAAATEVRRLTGFDRVLVYRFLEDESGMAIAEARSDALPSLLDHRFPGTDIPRQVRTLYLRNRFRIIPDANHVPTPLRPADPSDAGMLDMSDCALRSVSPMHLQYLRNMGVAASMSISLVVDNVLWGLIACHHSQPRQVPYELREACRHLGRVFSHQIGALEETRHLRQAASLRHLRAAWLDDLRLMLENGGPLELDLARLAKVVPCDGVALVSPGRVELSGHTPDEADVLLLANWLREPLRRDIFASRHLAGRLPAAAAYAAKASGVLATTVGTDQTTVVMWFRVEEAARVAWAGNPRESGGSARSPADLSPRASLENRQQSVRQTARRWTRAEVSAGRQLGSALTTLFQQEALRELNWRLRDALAEQQSLVAQKNVLMQEVHHRVQNSLQIVNSMLQLQARQSSDAGVRGQFEGAVSRLMAVSAVHRHLWRSSDAQSVRLGPYLKELCADLMLSWGEGWSGHLVVEASDAAIPSQTAVTLALLVTELLTNAAKYAYAGAPGPVEVRAVRTDAGELQVVVRDHGMGMHGKVLGGGLGSKLIRIFTAQLGAQAETRSGPGGTSVTIVVPPQPQAEAERKATPNEKTRA